MLLCEGKLKVNSVHFRLPSAAQKRALELAKSLLNFINNVESAEKVHIGFS